MPDHNTPRKTKDETPAVSPTGAEAGVHSPTVPIGDLPARRPAASTSSKKPSPIDKVIRVLNPSTAEGKREKLRKIIRTATWTARPPSSLYRSPETLFPQNADVPGVLSRKPIPDVRTSHRERKSKATPSRGLDRWETDRKEDYAHMLKMVFRSSHSKSHFVNDAAGLARSEFVQIPLSWHAHLKAPYRQGERTYFEAMHILAYVTSKYATGRFQGDMLLVTSPLLRELLGISADAESRALKYLIKRRLLGRVVILGYLPWSPKVKGSYRLLIPVLDNLIRITYALP